MKKLMCIATSAVAFAITGSLHAAAPFANAQSFDDKTVGTKVSAIGDSYFQFEGDGTADNSAIANWEGAAPTFGTVGMPEPFSMAGITTINKYLKLDTDTAKLFRRFNSANAPLDIDTGLYMDTLVQFTVTQPEADDPELGSDDKLALWLKAEENGGVLETNLYIISRCADYGEEASYEFATNRLEVTDLEVEAGQWYRLTVEAGKTVFNVGTPDGNVPYFKIYINGKPAKIVGGGTSAFSSDWLDVYETISSYINENRREELESGEWIPAGAMTNDGADTPLFGMGFQGEGGVDNITMGREVPNFLPGKFTAVDFYITMGEHVTAFDYAVAGGASASASTVSSVKVFPGATVTFSNIQYENGYKAGSPALATTNSSACVTLDGLVATLVAATEVPVVSFNAVEDGLNGTGTAADPFILATAEDFTKWFNGYNSKYGADKFYKLTASVDLGSSPFQIASDAAPFTGVFDGGNNKITFTLAEVKYTGFFKAVQGATISNLVLETSVDYSASAGEIGGAILVGNAIGANRFENITTEGAFTANHNVCGVVCYSAGQAADLTFIACTNHATLYSAYSKAGGIFGYTQEANSKVYFEKCYNNGSITLPGMDSVKGAKLGGICAGNWSAVAYTFVDCVNAGTLSGTQNICKNSSNYSVEVGGIMGQCTAGSVVFTNCVNLGSVTGVSGAGANGSVSADAEIGGVGGIVGNVSVAAVFSGCSSTVAVTHTIKENPSRCYTGELAGYNGTVTHAGANTCPYGATPAFGVTTATFTGKAVAYLDAEYDEATTATWMNLAELVATVDDEFCVTIDGQKFYSVEASTDNMLGLGTQFVATDGAYNKTKALAYVGSGLDIDDDGLVIQALTPVTPVITPFDPAVVEYSGSLEFPAVTISGDYVKDTDYTVAWDPSAITEPAEGATNTYTVTVTMIGSYTGSSTAQWKVFKAAAPAEPDPIKPGEGTMETTIVAADADAATNAVVVTSPDAAVVSNDEYKKYFDLTATPTANPGEFKVTAALSADKIELEESVEDLTEALTSVAAAATSADVTVVAKPGLYYTLYAGDALNAINPVEQKQAPAAGTLTFATPNKGAKGFYKIRVDTAAAPK